MYFSFKSICNKEHKGVYDFNDISQSTRPTGGVLWEVLLSILDFTHNYERRSGNFFQSTHPVGRVLWEELLILSSFHS